MKNLVIVSFIFFFCLSCKNMDEIEEYDNTNIGNFESLWNTIDTRYCFFSEKKINWDSIYYSYKPKVEALGEQDSYSFFYLMDSMLDNLKDGHVNLYSNFDVGKYWDWYEKYPDNYNSELIDNKYLGSNYKMAGGIKYSVLSDNNNSKFGYMSYSDFNASFSDQNMYYIFSLFKNSAVSGVILDVRNNGGGLMTLSEKLASYFISEDKIGGYYRIKNGQGHDDFSNYKPIWLTRSKINCDCQVVVLTNRKCFSATNNFVSYVKDEKNVTILGDTTGGGGGMPFSSILPNGWSVRFSTFPQYNSNKNSIENGIAPEVLDSLTQTNELKGIDNLINDAALYILKLNRGN